MNWYLSLKFAQKLDDLNHSELFDVINHNSKAYDEYINNTHLINDCVWGWDGRKLYHKCPEYSAIGHSIAFGNKDFIFMGRYNPESKFLSVVKPFEMSQNYQNFMVEPKIPSSLERALIKVFGDDINIKIFAENNINNLKLGVYDV